MILHSAFCIAFILSILFESTVSYPSSFLIHRDGRPCAPVRADGIARSNVTHDGVDGLLYVLDKRLRVSSDPEREDDERQHVGPLSPRHILQLLVLRIIYVAEEHALV